MNKKLSSHPLVWGTLLLTLTGLISRTIGFFYRIYLSRCFGEEGMGIYQLLGPVLSLSFALTASGYQTAISKVIAEKTAGDKKSSPAPSGQAFLSPFLCPACVLFLSVRQRTLSPCASCRSQELPICCAFSPFPFP